MLRTNEVVFLPHDAGYDVVLRQVALHAQLDPLLHLRGRCTSLHIGKVGQNEDPPKQGIEQTATSSRRSAKLDGHPLGIDVSRRYRASQAFSVSLGGRRPSNLDLFELTNTMASRCATQDGGLAHLHDPPRDLWPGHRLQLPLRQAQLVVHEVLHLQ